MGASRATVRQALSELVVEGRVGENGDETLASLIGRGARFFLVAGLMAWGGERMEGALRKYVDRIGWATVAAVVVGVLVYRAT